MAATKLGLYTEALRLCGERKLSSLTEAREPRYLLDDAYGDGSTNGAVRACLEMGYWTFATRTIQLDYSPSVNPTFGYRYAFDQPSDMVRVAAICEDEHFNVPLTAYADERAYWYCDLQEIYVRYISNSATYGADLSLWPENFAKMVAAYLALEIVHNLTGKEGNAEKVQKVFSDRLLKAKSFDAMNKPTVFLPTGSWVSARRGGSNRDRGNRSQLIG